MSKIVCVLLVNIVLINTCNVGERNVNVAKKTYKAIFTHTMGWEYFITDMSNKYRVRKLQTIDGWLDMDLPFTKEKYSERIVSLLNYHQMSIQISMYLTRNPRGGTIDAAAYDICYIDIYGNVTKKNLCVSDKVVGLAFAKIIDNTLCIGLYEKAENTYPVKIESTNLYTIRLDLEDYPIIEYHHNLGEVSNIWIQNDGKMLYTTYNDNKLESGILNISYENDLKLIELFDYSIIEYDTISNQMIGLDSNGQLFYRGFGENIHILNNVKGIVYRAFFLELDKIIICSYIERESVIGNFLFGGENTYNVYSYYSLHLNGNDVFSFKKINTINRLWNLEQITRQ